MFSSPFVRLATLVILALSASCKPSAESDLTSIVGDDLGKDKILGMLSFRSSESGSTDEIKFGLVECIRPKGSEFTADEKLKFAQLMSATTSLYMDKDGIITFKIQEKGAEKLTTISLPCVNVSGNKGIKHSDLKKLSSLSQRWQKKEPRGNDLLMANSKFLLQQSFFLAMRGPTNKADRTKLFSPMLASIIAAAAESGEGTYDPAKLREGILRADQYFNPCVKLKDKSIPKYLARWKMQNYSCVTSIAKKGWNNYKVNSKLRSYKSLKKELINALAFLTLKPKATSSGFGLTETKKKVETWEEYQKRVAGAKGSDYASILSTNYLTSFKQRTGGDFTRTNPNDRTSPLMNNLGNTAVADQFTRTVDGERRTVLGQFGKGDAITRTATVNAKGETRVIDHAKVDGKNRYNDLSYAAQEGYENDSRGYIRDGTTAKEYVGVKGADMGENRSDDMLLRSSWMQDPDSPKGSGKGSYFMNPEDVKHNEAQIARGQSNLDNLQSRFDNATAPLSDEAQKSVGVLQPENQRLAAQIAELDRVRDTSNTMADSRSRGVAALGGDRGLESAAIRSQLTSQYNDSVKLADNAQIAAHGGIPKAQSADGSWTPNYVMQYQSGLEQQQQAAQAQSQSPTQTAQLGFGSGMADSWKNSYLPPTGGSTSQPPMQPGQGVLKPTTQVPANIENATGGPMAGPQPNPSTVATSTPPPSSMGAGTGPTMMSLTGEGDEAEESEAE
jgi:hypothetical protein